MVVSPVLRYVRRDEAVDEALGTVAVIVVSEAEKGARSAPRTVFDGPVRSTASYSRAACSSSSSPPRLSAL